ncbi:hypothetical protein P691DRAFT_762215 [Macrolepiota fuliginosa MF-IS2]|uniref:Uncharacterized protein n=1 Tax=Macrolepiota fuliginosa MF-IS2 TaxID=1400762 RepID=A0A9P6BZT2_9AGAR|nr:hypothetical protein P691DRAFT_762215 [Macrolepiota fuliginosa MF-IS2]
MSCVSYSRSHTSNNDVTDAGGLEKASLAKSAHSCQDELQEGGLQAWLTLAGAFLIQVSTFGYTLSFGAYQGMGGISS